MNPNSRAGATVSQEIGSDDFDAFYAAEHARLFRAMVLLSGDRAEADDIAQEAFVAVFERWDRVSRMEAPLAYLYRIALNQHRSRVRRAVRWAQRSMFERGMDDTSDSAIARADVHRALGALTLDQRSAVVLVDWVGLTSAEAGEVLGLQATGVRARLHRAREKLREELNDDG